MRLVRQSTFTLGHDSLGEIEREDGNARNLAIGEMKTLSTLDRAILGELTNDPFASNGAVAEKLGVPTGVVASRLRALERSKVSQVLAVLDLERMNQSFCFVHVDVRGRPVVEVAEEIGRRRVVLMVSEFADGASDLLVLVRYSDTASLRSALYEDIANIAGIFSWRVDVVVSVPIFRAEYVTYNEHHRPLSIEDNIAYLKDDLPKGICDDTDLRIIAHLQQNAHQSINNVARELGIKSTTARYRINNLKNSNILRFIRVIDQGASGINTFTLAELSVEVGRISDIVEALSDKPWLPQLFVCAGNATLVGILLTESAEEVIRIKREELLAIPGIYDVTLSYLFKTHKTDYRWAQEPSAAMA